MYEILRPEKSLTIAKIKKTDIAAINLIMAPGTTETVQQLFSRQGAKPDLMSNGGLFNMKDGTTLSQTIDEGKVISNKYYSNFGLFTDFEGKFGFSNFKATGYKDFIGGSPALIRGGKINPDNIGLEKDFLTCRHPRTVYGDNPDYFFMVAVDGRRIWAKGMSTDELANYMFYKLSCLNAINVDGGGSTHLYRNNAGKLEALNSPTENRAVDNHLCLFLKAQPGKIFRTITATKLNIRAKGKGTLIVGQYDKGTVVEILEIKDGWARTIKGWISTEFLK